MLDVTKQLSDELVSLVDSETATEDEKDAKVAAIVNQFVAMQSEMLSHFAEEETFWPSIVKQHGFKVYKEMEKQILSHGMKSGIIFNIFYCSVSEAMGIAVAGVPLRPGEKGWASSASCKKFEAGVPYLVRLLLSPGWNKIYQKYKTTILSVARDEDLLAEPVPVAPSSRSSLIAIPSSFGFNRRGSDALPPKSATAITTRSSSTF
jgi:hypothetical protein